jgi:putative oxidoreductase
MATFMKPYAPQAYAAMRILFGLLFMSHGMQKLFGLFGGVPAEAPPFVIYVGGGIELVTGALIAIGLFTRWAAFLAAGEMAAAYWMGHGLHAFHPLVNKGELAILYCFAFLFISAHGAGIWSADGDR